MKMALFVIDKFITRFIKCCLRDEKYAKRGFAVLRDTRCELLCAAGMSISTLASYGILDKAVTIGHQCPILLLLMPIAYTSAVAALIHHPTIASLVLMANPSAA